MADKNRSAEEKMAPVIQVVIENGRAATNEELAEEFEFEASEQGWSDDEIKTALNSPFFPQI